MIIETKQPLMILDSGWWPNNAYGLIKENIFTEFSENSWTVTIQCKICNPDKKNKLGIFYRKGKNSGLYYLPNGELSLIIWTMGLTNGNHYEKSYKLTEEEKSSFNIYTIQHDKELRFFKLFVNKKEVIKIDYFEKFNDYKSEERFFAIGMQNKMNENDTIVEENEIDIEKFIFYNKVVEQDEIIEFIENESEKIIIDKYGREVIKDKVSNMVNYTNFKNMTDYKIWDLTGNNVFLMKYFPESKISLHS